MKYSPYIRSYSWSINDPSIQVTEALIFLHSLHYLHNGLSSHAVMLVSNSVTKLAMLDRMVSQEEPKKVVESPPDHLAAWRCQLLCVHLLAARCCVLTK